MDLLYLFIQQTKYIFVPSFTRLFEQKYKRITRLLHVLTFVFFITHTKQEKKECILTLGKSIPTLLFFTFTLKISRDKMVCARLTRVSKL